LLHVLDVTIRNIALVTNVPVFLSENKINITSITNDFKQRTKAVA